MKKHILQEIGELNAGPVKYVMGFNNFTLNMEGHTFPISIGKHEFDFLYNIVKKYNLKRGFELATGFGVSSIAAGLAFKENNGIHITMDSYSEEVSNNCHDYGDFKNKSYPDTDGYKSVKYLIEYFRLKDTVIPEVGWSPDDVGTIINRNTTGKLDFVFLDGGHFIHQILQDVDAIRPHLDEKFVFVFHDFYPSVIDYPYVNELKNKFGLEFRTGVSYPLGENMVYMTNFD